MSRQYPSPLLVDATYAQIRDQIVPSAVEVAWRAVDWLPSLGDAVAAARAEGKPILLWAMDGHPLGSTCGNGIATRRTVWADDAVQRLARAFVAAADDAGALMRGDGDDAAFFRHVAEQGHFGGRTVPTTTRQGIYAFTAGGRLLASANTVDARTAEQVLRRALARWDERRDETAAMPVAARRARRRDDGLVLRVYTRDLPRDGVPAAPEWNQDHAWFDADEARAFVPEAPGRHVLPRALALRLARFHLVDNVRGQTVGYDAADVEVAALASKITARDGDLLVLRLEGAMRARRHGVWPVDDVADAAAPGAQDRGYDLKLLGHAAFDAARGRFSAFELVAAGTRWGGTQYNRRAGDLGPAPIGIVFVLAADRPAVAPALAYG